MLQTQGFLIIEKKNGSDGKPHPVDRTLILGRGQTCDVRVHVQSVSEEHCIIIVDPGRPVCIRNLSETSPTLLNGVSIGTKKCELQHGDYVSLGERRFRWEYLNTSPFYRLELNKLRRKSDADAVVRGSSQPVAVVFPMTHMRRTFEPSIIAQLKRNFSRVSAASRLNIAADTENVSSPSPLPEKSLNDGKGVDEDEGGNPLKYDDPQPESSLFKTPRKVGMMESRKSVQASVTPLNKQPAPASKQTPDSTSAEKAQKRRLTITPIPAKRLKIESPKSLDKRKIAALRGIHGKSPAVLRSTTPVKSGSAVKSSTRSTAKESASSTAKKSVAPPRSTQKSRRPLFSEILKKAVVRANAPSKTPGKTKLAVATKKTLFSGVAKRKAAQAAQKQQSLSVLTKVRSRLQVQSTGHANSPETIFVGRKLAQSLVSQGVSRSPAEWVKSARNSVVSNSPKQTTPKRKGPLRPAKELPSTSSPSKTAAKSPKVATPSKSPLKARASLARTTTPKTATPISAKRTSLANPLLAKTPLRASINMRGSPATRKTTTPKTATPKMATPKTATPKMATLKPATPKTATPKTATPKTATPKTATPKTATPKTATPKTATPKTATPKTATPKTAIPKTATPKTATPKVATPKMATPKVATSMASPKETPELPKPTPRVLKRVAEKGVKRISLPIPLRVKTPRLAKRASLPKSTKISPSKSLAKNLKPTTLNSPMHESPTKSPKPTTPKSPKASLASSPKPITPVSPMLESSTKSPKWATVRSSMRMTPAKSPKPTTPKSLKRASLVRSHKTATPKLPMPKSPAKSPKPTTPKSPLQESPAKSRKPTTPKSPVNKSPSKSPKLNSPTSLERTMLVKSPSPVQLKLATRASLARSPKPSTPRSPVPSKSSQLTASEFLEHSTPYTTSQPRTSNSILGKSFGASPKPAISNQATPKSFSSVSPKVDVTPKLETPKGQTPQRTPLPSSSNFLLETMKRTTPGGSPTKRISLPSASESSAVDAHRMLPETISPAKRTRESSPNTLSGETSKQSPSGDSLVQALRARMAKFSPDHSKRSSTATPVVLKSPVKNNSFEAPAQLVTSTPAPGHRSSILIQGSNARFKGSPPKSVKSNDSSNRYKNLSVTFSESLISPGHTPSSSKVASQSATPENEKTSFDFSAVKTPNVPRELYVSSILSSSSKNSNTSGKASGSAKRKSRVTGTRENLTTALCSDRRSLRSPLSPGGYVDVKGIKRLTAAPIKSPTYLAVEGVKRLFGEAKAIASDSYTSISGVRELFASPSPSRNRSPEKIVARDSVASSPVAKIQAQVEERNWNAPKPSPKPAPAQQKKVAKASRSSESPVQVGRTTRSARNPRVRIASPPKEKPKSRKLAPKSPPKVESETTSMEAKVESSAKTSPEKSKPAQATHRRVVSFDLPEDQPLPTAQRSTRNQPKVQEELTQTSPPSKRGRSAATSQRDSGSSPEQKRTRNSKKTRPKAEEKTSPRPKRTKKSDEEVKSSPVKEPEEKSSPIGRRGRTTRANVAETASPVARRPKSNVKDVITSPVFHDDKVSPVAKRGRLTRKNLVEDKSASPVGLKRGRSARNVDEETLASPAKKSQTENVKEVGLKRGRSARNVDEEAVASPAKKSKSENVKEVGLKRGRSARNVDDEAVASPAKKSRTQDIDEVAPKRGARKNAVSAKEESSSPAPKREAKGKDVEVDSPVGKRKTKKTKEEKNSPVAKRATRAKGGKGKAASPAKKGASPSKERASPAKKRGVSTKKGTSPAKKEASPVKAASPPKRTTRAKDKSAKGGALSPKPSPRKTRQRK